MNGKWIEQSDSDDDDDDVILISTVGKSREERLEMFMDTFTDEFKASWDLNGEEEADRRGCRPMKFRDFANHDLDRMESDGFDMNDYSKFNDPGILIMLYYPPEKQINEEYRAEFEECSRLAVDDFNTKHGTHYGNVHVVKAISQALSPCRYYITFQATDGNNKKENFQARVNIRFSELKGGQGGPKFEKVVELVRIRTAPKPIVISMPRKAIQREGRCSGPASTCAA